MFVFAKVKKTAMAVIPLQKKTKNNETNNEHI
jgi:hypothetical protein